MATYTTFSTQWGDTNSGATRLAPFLMKMIMILHIPVVTIEQINGSNDTIEVFLNALPIWQFDKRLCVMVGRLPNRLIGECFGYFILYIAGIIKGVFYHGQQQTLEGEAFWCLHRHIAVCIVTFVIYQGLFKKLMSWSCELQITWRRVFTDTNNLWLSI